LPTLDWLSRAADLKAAAAVPYRLLTRVSELSLAAEGADDDGAASGKTGGVARGDNLLIEGDNLGALKALLPYYRGKVKCIYIDPPYNTRSAFTHYDDNLEHSQWLAMIYPRLELLRDLLSDDGSIWVSIDDNEGHYLKVVMDEVFGRGNFIANVIWQKKYAPANDAIWLSDSHDHVMLFAANSRTWKPNKLDRTDKEDRAYKNPDNDTRGVWKAGDYTCNKSAKERPNLYYPIIHPRTGLEVWPKKTAVWRYQQETHFEHVKERRIWWGKAGDNAVPAFKRFLGDLTTGVVPQTIWQWDDVGHNQDGKKEQLILDAVDPFGTPKPERLIQRILHIATHPGDLVLDSFLGSGTTAAVAHKMGRRWIGIEMGGHAVTHCAPRLTKVIAGEQGGISATVGWRGGGGFGFYRLGSPVFDANGRIAAGIAFADLAAHLWFAETGAPLAGEAATSPYLGQHAGRGIALLYNGILRDKRPRGGNVLTRATLDVVRAAAGDFIGPLTIYAEASRIGAAALAAANVTFRQTPYDIRAR